MNIDINAMDRSVIVYVRDVEPYCYSTLMKVLFMFTLTVSYVSLHMCFLPFYSSKIVQERLCNTATKNIKHFAANYV